MLFLPRRAFLMKKNLLYLFFIVLPLFASQAATAQKFLALDKPAGREKRLRFFEGDRLTFRLKNDPTRYSGIITRLEEQSLYIGETRVLVSDIDAVTIQNRYKDSGILNSAPYMLPLAGLIYFAADGLNPGSRISSSTYIVSGSLIGTGVALKLFQKKTYRINGPRRLKIIDLGAQMEQGVSVRGIVRESAGNMPVLAELIFESTEGSVRKSVVTSGTGGFYKITLPYGKVYRVYANSELYLSPEKVLDLNEYKDFAIVDLDVTLVPAEPGRFIEMNGLTFSKIDQSIMPGSLPPLDRFVAKLREKPELKVEIVPTPFGEEDKNSILRAEVIRRYMIEKGIDAVRITVSSSPHTMPKETMKRRFSPETVLFLLK